MRNLRISAIITRLKEVFLASPALEAWCQANYSKSLAIQIGADDRDHPGEAQCPFVAITSPASSDGAALDNFTNTFKLFFGIYDERKTVTGQVTEYQGLTAAAELANLLGDALIESFSDESPITEIEVEIDDIAFFPLIIGGLAVSIDIENVIGGTATI
jgi:hypothetical protein